MKKIILLLIVVFATGLTALAQTNFRICAGYNMATWGFGGNDATTWISGFNVGISTDIGKGEKVCFRPGFYFSAKGYGHDDNVVPYVKLHYLEMPLLSVFKIRLGDNAKLEMQAGWYFAYGVGGKTKVQKGAEYSSDNHSINIGYVKEKSFGGNSEEDRFDTGINAGVGINVYRFYIGTSYDFGTLFSCKNSHHCFMLNVGFRIL